MGVEFAVEAGGVDGSGGAKAGRDRCAELGPLESAVVVVVARSGRLA